MSNATPVIKTVVFQRPECDGGTIAVVHFHMTDNTKAPLERLKPALTAWVLNTGEGRDAWAASSEDFNIGDLSEYYGHSLMPYLNEQGITSIVFANVSDDNAHAAYDEVLVNTDEVDAVFPLGMGARTTNE